MNDFGTHIPWALSPKDLTFVMTSQNEPVLKSSTAYYTHYRRIWGTLQGPEISRLPGDPKKCLGSLDMFFQSREVNWHLDMDYYPKHTGGAIA